MLPIGNNIGRHQRCPLMLPPATHKSRCCRGLSAHWLAHAFAWWRLLPCVIVWWIALVRFCPWIPSDSTLAPVLQILSEAQQKPLRWLGRTQACALRYSLIRWWVSTVGLSPPVGYHYTRISEMCNGNFNILFLVFSLTLTRVLCLGLARGTYTGTHTLST
jgi:hypothetical protein